MKKSTYYSAVAMLVAVAVPASVFAAPDSSADFDATGPDSYNKVKIENRTNKRVNNNTRAELRNRNVQTSYSGHATVEHNTTGGDARSGSATTSNSYRVNATVDNSGAAAAMSTNNSGGSTDVTMNETGPSSTNIVRVNNQTRVNVNNNTNVKISNSNDQLSESGDARVSGNTTGGSAVSGNASSTNTSEVTLRIEN